MMNRPARVRFGLFRRRVATVSSYRGPIRRCGRQRRSERLELSRRVDDFSHDDGHQRGDVLDALVLDGEVVGGENGEVGELPWDEPSLLAILSGEPRAPLGPEPK